MTEALAIGPPRNSDPSARGQIVLLEDDDLDAELVAEQLRSYGLRLAVNRARNEREYVSALAASDVLLVLSDFSLPGYDGLRALEAARQLAPAAPFLFVSGAIGEELAIDTMRRGATDYVLKSRLERLGPAVVRALGEAEDRRLRRAAELERDELLLREREAREAAEAANRLKDEFLALVSHELRTPLNAILGWASLLVRDREDAAALERGLATIERNARVQARLIEDILDIARIVTGKLQLQPARVEVEGFVSAAIDTVRPAATAKRIELLVSGVEDAGTLFADGDRLQQIVWNLVSNAVKFTPADGRVEVRVERFDEAVEIVVSDSGPGIARDLLPHVFERFRQGDGSKTRAQGGLGLGLAIVRHLTEMHGGTVTAGSDGPGEGATFTVRLPVEGGTRPSGELAPPSAKVFAQPPPVRSVTLEGVRVLVVDDEPDAREVVVEVLRSSGAEVSSTGTVLEALRELGAFRPHVVISDIGMPYVDGYTLMRRIRSLEAEEGGHVPAIALTAYARDVDRAEAEAAGYARHVAKPVSPELLVATVVDVLGRASA
jgi:signal transduction histidine kinase